MKYPPSPIELLRELEQFDNTITDYQVVILVWSELIKLRMIRNIKQNNVIFKPEDFDWVMNDNHTGSKQFKIKLADTVNEQLKNKG